MKVEVKVTQSCPALCDPMDHTVHGILQARILEWVAYHFSRGSSQPRNRTKVSIHALQVDSLTTELSGKPNVILIPNKSINKSQKCRGEIYIIGECHTFHLKAYISWFCDVGGIFSFKIFNSDLFPYSKKVTFISNYNRYILLKFSSFYRASKTS